VIVVQQLDKVVFIVAEVGQGGVTIVAEVGQGGLTAVAQQLRVTLVEEWPKSQQ
jgi:hypothetical protein